MSEMTKPLKYSKYEICYRLMMLQIENECNKYELERVRRDKFVEKTLDSISYPFECEYFKVKK